MTIFIEYSGAIFLIILSYLVPLLFSSIRDQKYCLATFYVVTTALHLVSLFNYAVFTLPGADLDAATFSKSVLISSKDHSILSGTADANPASIRAAPLHRDNTFIL